MKKGNIVFALLSYLCMVVLTVKSCSKSKEYYENQRREIFNRNFQIFNKLEQMQREDINVFAISTTRHVSFIEAKGLKRAIEKGYSYKQNNIDRYEHVATHKSHYEFKDNEGLTNERWNEYKKFLKQANLFQLIYQYDRPDKRQVWFHDGIELDTGFVYMEFPPTKYFNSFEECKPIMPSRSCYIVLRKNWFMYSEKFRLEQE